jgi:hypothetical protein
VVSAHGDRAEADNARSILEQDDCERLDTHLA